MLPLDPFDRHRQARQHHPDKVVEERKAAAEVRNPKISWAKGILPPQNAIFCISVESSSKSNVEISFQINSGQESFKRLSEAG